MPLPLAPDHMWRLRGQTVKHFGYDQETDTQYSFNSLGYRSAIEFEPDSQAIVVLGNTISFGPGLDVAQSFAGIIANHVARDVYNFAWGCYAHTNAEQLALLKTILCEFRPNHVIFQINNLNRLRINHVISTNNAHDLVVSEFEKFVRDLDSVLQDVPHTLLYWDDQVFSINLPRCVVYNKYHVDSSLQSNSDTFGSMSHKLIAHAILPNIIK